MLELHQSGWARLKIFLIGSKKWEGKFPISIKGKGNYPSLRPRGYFGMYTLFAHIEVWVYPTLHTVTNIGILADLYLVPHTLFFSAKISTKEVYCVFALLAKHFCCLLP